VTELSETDALEIVQRLISRTEQGALDWKIWQPGAYEYYATSPRFRYYAKTRDDDGTAPYVIQIYRSNLESAESHEGVEPPPTEELHSFPASAYSEAVEHLYRMARGKALNVESLKSDILDDLGDD
jgi:hypothetical protein